MRPAKTYRRKSFSAEAIPCPAGSLSGAALGAFVLAVSFSGVASAQADDAKEGEIHKLAPRATADEETREESVKEDPPTVEPRRAPKRPSPVPAQWSSRPHSFTRQSKMKGPGLGVAVLCGSGLVVSLAGAMLAGPRDKELLIGSVAIGAALAATGLAIGLHGLVTREERRTGPSLTPIFDGKSASLAGSFTF